jgi:succinate dehydrogenase / fumarate reductase cytochrome b subunit
MVFIGFHLSHGFQSAFQTLGLNHVKYTPVIQAIGLAFCILIPLGYAAIPVLMYLNSM